MICNKNEVSNQNVRYTTIKQELEATCMDEALATSQLNCTTASTKSHVHLQNVSGSTPPANEQRVFLCTASRTLKPKEGALIYQHWVRCIDHSVRKILTPQPKKCWDSRSSVALDLSLLGW